MNALDDVYAGWRMHANSMFSNPNTATERTLAARVLTLLDALDRATGPAPVPVTWTMDLDEARELYDYLHHNRPGGYQHMHDELREAIYKAAHP